MSNSKGRRLFREYAQSKGKVAKSFVNISSECYEQDTLTTMDDSGKKEETTISYKDMVHLLIAGKLKI